MYAKLSFHDQTFTFQEKFSKILSLDFDLLPRESLVEARQGEDTKCESGARQRLESKIFIYEQWISLID